MSVADEARAEARRQYPATRRGTQWTLLDAFTKGAEWEASRKVEVTDKMVLAAEKVWWDRRSTDRGLDDLAAHLMEVANQMKNDRDREAKR